MARLALRIEVTPKDQKELRKLVSGGVQPVRVVLRALALVQLAKGVSAPRISTVVALTPQAIRKVGHRYQHGGLERALYDKERPGADALLEDSQRQRIMAMVCSDPPEGRARWTVRYFFELTDAQGGETLRRIPVWPGDIILGDRIYSTPVGVAQVKAAQADIVVRLNRQSLPLFDPAENPVNVLRLFRKMKVGQTQEWATRVKPPGGGWITGRLIALKRSAEGVAGWNVTPARSKTR